MYRPTLNGQHSSISASIGENSTSMTSVLKQESCPSIADSESRTVEVHPVLKLYDAVNLRSRSSGRDFGTYSLSELDGNYPIHIIAINAEDQQISIPEIESLEMSLGGTLCGGGNIFFTRQYELTQTEEVATMFHDAPVPIRLVFDTELREEQMEDHEDLALDIDQVMTLVRMEIELGEEWRKLLALIRRARRSPPERSQRPRLSKIRSSFRLSKRLSCRDLELSGEFSVASNEDTRPNKEIRKAIKECRELRLQAPSGYPVYCRIPLEAESGQRRKGEWSVSTTDATRCAMKDTLKMRIVRGGIVYRLSDGSVKSDWSSKGQNLYKVHFDKSGLSWVTLHINTTAEDREVLGQLMSGSLCVGLGKFLNALDRSNLKCSVVNLVFSVPDAQGWFESLGVDLTPR